MKHVGKSKIGRLSAKGITYPQLRLPQQCSDTIGKIADVFVTEYKGKQAFLVVPELSMPKGDTVLKPSEEVLKSQAETSIESRLSAIESQIEELKQLIFKNNSISQPNQQKKSKEKAEVGIRTRVVASTGP